MKHFFYRILCGFFLGLSIFAPGFSGSVVAIILGVYQDLVRIASNPFKHFKRNILFCLPLGIGAVLSGVLFVFSFRLLFQTYTKAAYLLMVGLIAGNLPVLFARVRKCGFRARYLLGAACAFAAAFAFCVLAVDLAQPPGAESLTAGLPMLALSGLAGGAAAFIPGMSISTILIVMGVYGKLLFVGQSLLLLELAALLPFGVFGACALAGLVLASRGIKSVFERHPGLANALVLGFSAGSLAGILVQSLRLPDESFTWLLGGLMLAAGAGLSALFVVLGKKLQKGE